MVSLTFDDGPDPRGTPAVLDALAQAGAHATFFVLGSRVTRHPELLARILAEGHAVGVHGYEHLRHPRHDRATVEADLNAALQAIGGAPELWRVPWGDLAPWTAELAAAHGLTPAGWSVDTHDWRGDDAEAMLAAAEPELRPGAIVLAHDGIGDGALRADCAETARLIGPLVAVARARGLEPAVLDTSWDIPVGNPDFALA